VGPIKLRAIVLENVPGVSEKPKPVLFVHKSSERGHDFGSVFVFFLNLYIATCIFDI
jgi:hypothetical protein